MAVGLPDHEPEKDSIGAVTTASPGALSDTEQPTTEIGLAA
jgi:hypothetical protein